MSGNIRIISLVPFIWTGTLTSYLPSASVVPMKATVFPTMSSLYALTSVPTGKTSGSLFVTSVSIVTKPVTVVIRESANEYRFIVPYTTCCLKFAGLVLIVVLIVV